MENQAIGGRPRKWTDPIAFEKAVEEYFANKKEEHTWTGLALHLGFESRQSLQDYKDNEGFSYPIKKALMMIENKYEKALFKGNPGGPIFALKNFNWKDKQEVDQNISGGISINWEEPNIPNSKDEGKPE